MSLLGGIAGYAEEIADDERENRPPGEHFKEGAIKLAANIVGDIATNVVATTASHVYNETQIPTDDAETNSPKTDKQIQKDRFDYLNQKKLTHSESNMKATFIQLGTQGEQECFVQTPHHIVVLEHIKVTRARFIYISKGPWMSKMIIGYTEPHGEKKKQSTNSGNPIEIPIDSRDIRVSFEVIRFISIWCDVKKWDRFEKKWYGEPHIFEYEKSPEERRYTIDGPLYFEGVINVTNERFDDVKDL